MLTFDNGFTAVYDFAAPVLKTLEWPATVFMVTEKLDGESNWGFTTGEPMLPHRLMDAPQLRRLSAQSFSVHSHSLLHHDVTTLETSALKQELRYSRALIADPAQNQVIGMGQSFKMNWIYQ